MGQTNDNAVLENLVTQFSSPLHCLRELVQNSIDAGSPVVEVWTEYIPGDGHEGVIELHVDDFGEGMDEQIVDNQLTRLFASTKEEDLTKIGQFGIGFVSTFALKPKAILVETGRSGEYWEVLFHEDRSFTKTKLDVPVEGTQITIFLEGDVHRYSETVEGVQDTLNRWCSHSDTEVTFEDRSPVGGSSRSSAGPGLITINDPFKVPGDCMQTVAHEGTEIVLAYTDDPMYGFYNRGLTLALTRTGDDVLGEKRAKRFDHIAFKIKSRYLEHTLSRETVMRDANYEKAMKLLEQAADGPLFEQLIEDLEELAGAPAWGLGDVDRYRRLIGYLSREPAEHLTRVAERPILRTVDGRSTTLESLFQAWRRDGRVLVADESSELTDRLAAEGIPVLLGDFPGRAGVRSGRTITILLHNFIHQRHSSKLWNRFRSFALGADLENEARQAVARAEEVYLPVTPVGELDAIHEAARPLLEAAGELLDELNIGYRLLNACRMAEPVSDPPLFVVGRNFSEDMALPPRGIDADNLEERPEAAVNCEHPHFQRLLELWDTRPQMAAYCMAKSLLLSEDRLLNLDDDLMQAARRMPLDSGE